MQRFYRGRRNAVLVHRRDVPIVFTGTECGVEVLRHRSDGSHMGFRPIAPPVKFVGLPPGVQNSSALRMNVLGFGLVTIPSSFTVILRQRSWNVPCCFAVASRVG